MYQKFRQLLPISVISWGHVEERLRVHSTPRIVGVLDASGMWSDRSDIDGGTRREFGRNNERLRVHSTPRIVGVLYASGMWSDRSDIDGGTRREFGRNNVVIHLLGVCWSSVQGVFARRYS